MGHYLSRSGSMILETGGMDVCETFFLALGYRISRILRIQLLSKILKITMSIVTRKSSLRLELSTHALKMSVPGDLKCCISIWWWIRLPMVIPMVLSAFRHYSRYNIWVLSGCCWCMSSAIYGCTTLVSAVEVWFVGVVIRYPNGSVIFVVVWLQTISMMDGLDGLFLFVIGSRRTGDNLVTIW